VLIWKFIRKCRSLVHRLSQSKKHFEAISGASEDLVWEKIISFQGSVLVFEQAMKGASLPSGALEEENIWFHISTGLKPAVIWHLVYGYSSM